MSGVALLQEVRFAIGFKKQTDLVTQLADANLISLRQTNEDPMYARPINEDDAADLGKGPYITRTFPSHWESGGAWNGRLTSEAAAIIMAFGMGNAVKTATTSGFKYTMHEPNFPTDGLDMPATTVAVQIRTGGDAVVDKALIGVCCEEFGFNFRTGPGRDNATFTSQWLGTGSNARPSGVTIPGIYDEHSLNAGGITTLSLVGFNYISNKRFGSVDFKWKNNIRDQSSFYPGSGEQDGYQLRGRMRRGVPAFTLTAQVECANGSSEEDALLSQTEGTGEIIVRGAQIDVDPTYHSVRLYFPRLTVKAAPIQNLDGITAYNVEYSVMQDPVDGVMTFEATCAHDNILAAA